MFELGYSDKKWCLNYVILVYDEGVICNYLHPLT